MVTIDDNHNLYKMVLTGLISQVEAEEQYPKIQELVVKLESREDILMCVIAYFTTHGWNFMDLLRVIDGMTPPIFMMLNNALVKDDFHNFMTHFIMIDVERVVKEAMGKDDKRGETIDIDKFNNER